MPQPIITSTSVTFGGLALPNGQGTMTAVNLNDGTKWLWQDFAGQSGYNDDDYVQLTVPQLAWRSRSVVIARDRGPRVLTLAMGYQEASTAPSDALGVQIGLLRDAGLQRLSFDGSTYILAEFLATKNRTMLRKFPPYFWTFDLQFQCPEPQFRDITSTTVSPVTLNSGTATNFNVTYAGSVYAEPVYTLTIPNTNAAPIQSFALANVMAGQTLTINFPGNLAASTAWTVTIDASAFTVVNQAGTAYDPSGSFPFLYGPAGTVQQIRGTLTPASGTATGCTIGLSYQNRWVI